MEKVNLGVIGCGVIGPQHMQSAVDLEHVNLLAVADIDEKRAREAAEKFGAQRHYNDPMALLDDPDVQGVILALPAGLRVDLAVEALRRGKHIMVEKPAARDITEFDKMAIEAGDCIVACASARYLLVPHSAAVREFITGGNLGDIRTVHFRNLLPPGPPPATPPPAWRVSRGLNGGGILVNWSSYELDYIFGITGNLLRPRHVLAKWWQIPPMFGEYVAPGSDADEHYAAFISCDNNIAVYLERGERVASGPEASMHIVGSKGSLKLSMFPEEGKRVIFQEFSGHEMTERVIWEGDEDWAHPRVGIVDDFARAIAEGRQPATGLERGRMLQVLTDAIYTSGDENRPVEIE